MGVARISSAKRYEKMAFGKGLRPIVTCCHMDRYRCSGPAIRVWGPEDGHLKISLRCGWSGTSGEGDWVDGGKTHIRSVDLRWTVMKERETKGAAKRKIVFLF